MTKTWFLRSSTTYVHILNSKRKAFLFYFYCKDTPLSYFEAVFDYINFVEALIFIGGHVAFNNTRHLIGWTRCIQQYQVWLFAVKCR